MQLSQQAIDVLRAAEKQLVALAAEAGGERDYEAATAILDAARRVKLIEQGPVARGEGGVVLPSSALGGQPPAGQAVAFPARERRGPRRSDYPRFLRDGDSLVKVGWSKTEKSEYEHRSPKKVVEVLGRSLSEAGSRGRRFTMEKVLPLTDPADGSALPDYQSYLSLAWLRHCGLVVQHGRQGYSLAKGEELLAAIETSWQHLPVRS